MEEPDAPSDVEALLQKTLTRPLQRQMGLAERTVRVIARTIAGTWEDGFIHAGNLAYMTIFALFPFFITLTAIFSALGERRRLYASIDAVLDAAPPRVAQALGPVAHDVVNARHGWLLWVGGLVGLWTTTSLIETIRDILHRAYGTTRKKRFWRYRLLSTALLFGSMLLLLVSLSSQVLIVSIQAVLSALFPRLDTLAEQVAISGAVSAAALLGSIWMLFRLLTPAPYHRRRYRKWPGPVLVTAWWLLVAGALPRVLQTFFTYDLTYGSLAGVMITLFFFWLVGLGMVAGAELNAALAQPFNEGPSQEGAAEPPDTAPGQQA